MHNCLQPYSSTSVTPLVLAFSAVNHCGSAQIWHLKQTFFMQWNCIKWSWGFLRALYCSTNLPTLRNWSKTTKKRQWLAALLSWYNTLNFVFHHWKWIFNLIKLSSSSIFDTCQALEIPLKAIMMMYWNYIY